MWLNKKDILVFKELGKGLKQSISNMQAWIQWLVHETVRRCGKGTTKLHDWQNLEPWDFAKIQSVGAATLLSKVPRHYFRLPRQQPRAFECSCLDYHLWIHATCWCLCIECAPVWQARWWNEFSSYSIIWTCGFGISCWWGFKLKSFISRFLCFSYGLLIFITFCNLVVVPTCGECGCLLWWMQRNLQVLSFFYTR